MNPGYPLTLEQLKKWNKDIVNEYRDEKINAGFTFDGNRYDSDERARLNINGACTLALILKSQGQDFPPTFTWRTKDNQDIPMTADGIIGMAVTLGTYATTCYGASWYHKASVEAMTDVESLLAYDISPGWPS